MTQSPPPDDAPRRVPPAAPSVDLDALLQTVQTDARSTPAGATSAAPKSSTSVNAQTQPADVTARRVQALVRAFDVLHKQVSAIANQGETINSIAETQARDAKAIAGLERNVKYLRAIVIQLLQQASPPPAADVPPLQVKLLVGHLVEQYQQAEHDAALLTHWAMLFAGLMLGTAIGAVANAVNGVLLAFWVFGTVALLTLLVALIFWGLSRTARQRARTARRAMDESTLLRSIQPRSPGDAR